LIKCEKTNTAFMQGKYVSRSLIGVYGYVSFQFITMLVKEIIKWRWR